MMPNKRRTLLPQVIVGCIALFSHAPSFASKWAVTPYGFLQGGLRFQTDWSQPFTKKFFSLREGEKVSFSGIPIFAGCGALLNPTIVDGWHFSAEGMYYTHNKVIAEKNFEEHGGFISIKAAFPQSEGVENFVGGGVGGLWLTKLPNNKYQLEKKDEDAKKKQSEKKKEPNFALAVIVYAGRSWHLNNGVYLTMRGSYIVPSGENRKPSVSSAIGLHWHWI